jgi:hypothetical protein
MHPYSPCRNPHSRWRNNLLSPVSASRGARPRLYEYATRSSDHNTVTPLGYSVHCLRTLDQGCICLPTLNRIGWKHQSQERSCPEANDMLPPRLAFQFATHVSFQNMDAKLQPPLRDRHYGTINIAMKRSSSRLLNNATKELVHRQLA